MRRVFATGEEMAIASVFPAPGKTRYYESTITPEFAADSSGQVESVPVVMRDVTGYKRAQAELIPHPGTSPRHRAVQERVPGQHEP